MLLAKTISGTLSPALPLHYQDRAGKCVHQMMRWCQEHLPVPQRTMHHDQDTMNTSEFEDIRSIEDLEMVSETTIWQNFERLTAFIFEKNDFTVNVNTVKTRNKKKRQYDVISRKDNQTFLVECKKWAGSRYRLSALKKAVEQHKERTAFYENIMNEDTIPVVVTLVEEEIHVYEGVPIVPILKLNSFIRESDSHGPGDFFYDYEDILEDLPAVVSVFPEQDEGEP